MELRALRRAAGALVVAMLGLAGPARADGVRDLPDEVALRLLAQYQPVLVFSTAGVEELFRPSDPFEFAQRAALQRRAQGEWETVRWNHVRLPTTSPCGRAPCWRLNLGPLDDRPTPRLPTFSPSLGKLIEPAYAYLPPRGGIPWARTVTYARATDGGTCCPGWVALQYWFFYPYNVWTRDPTRHDDYFQAHEGDWEAVVLVLDDRGTPRWGGFTQHEGGEGRSWQRLQKLVDTHPVVYVARGSHANYFEAGRHKIPLPLAPALARLARRFGIRLFDRAEPLPAAAACPPYAANRGAAAGPSAPAGSFRCYRRMEIALLRRQSWAAYPGLWGEDQWIGRDAAVDRFGVSPGRVVGRALWSDPVDTTLAWCRRHGDCSSSTQLVSQRPAPLGGR